MGSGPRCLSIPSHNKKVTRVSPEGRLDRELPLMPHQRETLLQYLKRPHLLNTSEAGTGKTLATLALVQYLNYPQTLIIAPKFLINSWKEECAKFEIPIESLTFMTHYEVRERRFPSRLPMIMVVDESHLCFGNPDSKTYKALMDFVRVANPSYRILLSGTPVRNQPSELYGQVKLLGYSELKHRRMFQERYCRMTPIYPTSPILKETGLGDESGYLKLMNQYSWGVKLEDVLSLGEIRNIEVQVEIPSSLDNALGEIIKDVPAEQTQEALARAMTGGRGIQVKRDTAIAKAIATCKSEFLDTLKGPTLLFTDHPDVVSIYHKHLAKQPHRVIDATTKPELRAQYAKEFQDGKVDLVICSIKCAGVGLNMYRAKYVVFSDYPWTPADYTQARARAYRNGNKGLVVYRIIGGRHDNHIMQLLTEKEELTNTISRGGSL